MEHLQYHLDKYKNNLPLQKLLINLKEYIKNNFDVSIASNSKYIQFNDFSGKKWAWIDTLDSGKAFKLIINELDEKGSEDFHELNSLKKDPTLEMSSRSGDKFSEIIIKGIINIYDPKFIAFLYRKYIENQKYYEDKEDIRKVKSDFYNVLGDESSLGHYQKAYIILLLKGFFELTDQKGKVKFDQIAEYFREFYMDRKNKGFQIENNPEDRIGEIEQSSLDDIKYIIKSNPLNTKTLEDRLCLLGNSVEMNKYLWLELSCNDIEYTKYILNKQLAKYFNERVDGDNMAIPDVDRNKIEEALEYFDKNHRDTEKWQDFTSNKNHKYAIRYNGNLYPVKKVISIATDAHVSTFSGGEESNNYLKSKGFEIVDIDQIKMNPLKKGLKEVLNNYVEARAHQEFAGNELGDLVRHKIPGVINEYLFRFNVDINQYEIKGSIGQGNWAKVPWIAIMNKNITTTTQEGIYVVYLFSNDMERLYLTFNQGVTNTSQDQIKNTRDELRKTLNLSTFNTDNNINLSDSGIGKEYELSTICYKEYKASEIKDKNTINEGVLVNDLKAFMDIYEDYIEKYSLDTDDKKFILRKKIDWSTFNWGFTIPIEYHNHFYNYLDKVIIPGTSQDVKLCYNNQQYEASIRNVDRNINSETLQVRYDGNDKFKELLRNVFSHSYEYIIKERERKIQDDAKRPNVDVPEDIAEFITMFYNGDSNQFIIELLTEDEEEKTLYEIINSITDYISSKGFTYPRGLIENFYLSLKTKPFVLLAGVSGTGKTKLVKLFAEAIGCTEENAQFKMISVRPDWSDSSDLLGYKDIQGKFQAGPMIDVLQNAIANPDNIYFVCLDEMNLARVEYYFSDFLSIMETRRKDEEGRILTSYLLNDDVFANPDDKEKYNQLIIPDNLYIVGTVNMDETTHPFSKKVLDRANTIEFSEIDLLSYRLSNDKDDIQKDMGRISNEFLKADYLTLNDCSAADEEIIKEIVENIQKVNDILEEANLQVGYRVRDEFCFYMIYNEHESLIEKDKAFDFQLVQKILPRIQGSSRTIKNVLIKLYNFTTGENLSVQEGELGDTAIKLVEDFKDGKNNIRIKYPMSAEKIATMIKRIEEDGFTAYWL